MLRRVDERDLRGGWRSQSKPAHHFKMSVAAPEQNQPLHAGADMPTLFRRLAPQLLKAVIAAATAAVILIAQRIF